MKITTIPSFAYFGMQSHRADVHVLQSNIIVQKLASQSSVSWSNIREYNLNRINTWLGDNLINTRYHLSTIYNSTSNNFENHPDYYGDFVEFESIMGINTNIYAIPDSVPITTNTGLTPNHLYDLHMNEYATFSTIGVLGPYTPSYNIPFNSQDPVMGHYIRTRGTNFRNVSCRFRVLTEENFLVNGSYDLSVISKSVVFDVEAEIATDSADHYYFKSMSIEVVAYNDGVPGPYTLRLSSISPKGSEVYEVDPDNPYGINGNSTEGGGDGTLNARGLDAVDPAEVPELPAIGTADLGFVTMYNPTAAQLKSLADFMWSNLFDLNTYKKLFSDPMESIIGLSVVPINPTIGGSKNVMFGTIDSGISMDYLYTNWCSLDCGWCSIEKYIGAFLDSDPYTKVSIYLPFIGIRQLSADDVNGRMVHVVYHVDVLTGACAAFIEVEGRGVLYTYNGSCITNIPLTSVNFSGAIQNAVSAVISGIGTVAGMATGAAPVTAMGISGLMNSAANTALNSKPSVQRSGALGGSAGIMSIMRPYLIIERPDISVPYKVQHFAGQACNLTMDLANCSGFTMCEFVHIENVPATTDEVREIEALLHEGVYL